MEFKNEELKVTFTIPEKLTIRQRLQYDSVAYGGTEPYLERLWEGAKAIIQEWHAPFAMEIDLDKETDSDAAAAVEWVGRAVFSRMFELKELPKNS